MRKSPWTSTSLTSTEMINRIMNHDLFRFDFSLILHKFELNFLLRPLGSINENKSIFHLPECCIWALKQCWSDNPNERPDFKLIRNKLKPLRKGLKNNILDNMLDIMERYTTNLEVR